MEPVVEDSAEPERGTHHVQSLERGLTVIKAFDAGSPSLTLSDVAKAPGLTRAAARRFLLTLVDLGYVRTDGKLFSLTARVLELGYAYLSSLTLPEVAQPHMERLSAEVRESSSVSVLDGTDIVYVARVAVSRIMTVTINVGTRFPAHATSMGHVLLAGLDAGAREKYLHSADLTRFTEHTITSVRALASELDGVRARGWSLVDQELEEGLRSIAAPIHGASGSVVAAINLSTHASRTTEESVRDDLLPRLLRTAKDIEADLAMTTMASPPTV